MPLQYIIDKCVNNFFCLNSYYKLSHCHPSSSFKYNIFQIKLTCFSSFFVRWKRQQYTKWTVSTYVFQNQTFSFGCGCLSSVVASFFFTLVRRSLFFIVLLTYFLLKRQFMLFVDDAMDDDGRICFLFAIKVTVLCAFVYLPFFYL